MEGFLLICLIVVTILWFLAKNKLTATQKDLTQKLDQLKATTDQEKAGLNSRISTLEAHNQALSKYQGIVDADAKAYEILNQAQTISSSLLKESQEELSKAKLAAKELRSEASREAQSTKSKAETTLSYATIDAKKIIDNAHKKAEEIAGDAYRAMQNVANLEKAAKAMKNIIDGYDNLYLVPSYSLLDGLADEFGHVEAGEQLKRVREQIRLMVKNRVAAKCDYAEANRRDTAIDFVVDAFNGKVDTLLTTVKRDNYGILEQKIKDAFQVVNVNGQAFRNALITDQYLQVRIEELKWTVILNELKWQEKEEQRLIKEKIREEEKARREYEKAIKEAEKEEDLLKKAIEKAQKAVEQGNAEQRAKFEEKLRELNEKLKAAEEKNQRALSMAQQTKAGNVYIISNVGSFGENVYKIGMTRRLEPLDRVKELGDASVPFEFDVHSLIYSEDAPKLETELHKKFIQKQINKVNPRKEFFRLSIKDIKEEIEKMGIEAKWTMAAEAREYRESLNIEQAISSDASKQAEWLKYQLENVTADVDEEPIEQ